MTCGRSACQRQRHAKRCKDWHQRQKEAQPSSHYKDVVRPFREKHPSYQRRLRIVHGLGEIREQIVASVTSIREPLLALLGRGDLVLTEGTEPEQPRAITGKPLAMMLDAMASIPRLLQEITETLGAVTFLRSPERETRYESS